jgi:predicted GIY-YIG superfamily endonuclease
MWASPTTSCDALLSTEGLVEGFTKQYGVKMLVQFEEHESIVAAIARENG